MMVGCAGVSHSAGLRRPGSTSYAWSHARGAPLSAAAAPSSAVGVASIASADPSRVRRTSPRHSVHRQISEPQNGHSAHSSSHASTAEPSVVGTASMPDSVAGTSFGPFRMTSIGHERQPRTSSVGISPRVASTFKATVQNLAGDRLEVSMDMNLRTTVLHLKMHIFTQWRVPPAFQQLVNDMVVLQDSDLLSSLGRTDCLPCTLTMGLVLKEIYSALDDPDNSMRCKAIDQLGRLAHQGDSTAVAELIERLSDYDGEVRLQAVISLCVSAERGNEQAAKAIQRCMKDPYVSVRIPAMRALAQLALRGHDHAAALVVACVEDADLIVRSVALELLLSITKCHYDQIVLLLGERSAMHRCTDVRQAAKEALEALAKQVGERSRSSAFSVKVA